MESEQPFDFLIDTNILIDHLRHPQSKTILSRALFEYGKAAVSRVTYIEYAAGELYAGRKPNFAADFPPITILPLNEPVLHRAPFLQADSMALNRKMALADLLIAATAIYHNLPLLTLNRDDFRHLPHLRLVKVP